MKNIEQSILIYQDYVNHNNNAHVLVALQMALTDAQINFCDADDIINGCLTPDIDLFIIPGGADLYICEKLNGVGNKAIKNYVGAGGTYLGICAGAYYGCKTINWDQGNIKGARELGFYKGCATGPIYNFLEQEDINKSWDQAIQLTLNNGTTKAALYRAGPYFSEPSPEDGKVTVLARYTEIKDTPPAIINCSIGKGRAILSAPHIEYSPNMYKKMIYKHNNPSYQWQSDVQKQYEKGYTPDQALFEYILTYALNTR